MADYNKERRQVMSTFVDDDGATPQMELLSADVFGSLFRGSNATSAVDQGLWGDVFDEAFAPSTDTRKVDLHVVRTQLTSGATSPPARRAVISPNELERIELKMNPHSDQDELRRYHDFACKIAPNTMKLRDANVFDCHPDRAILQVWLSGSEQPITCGMAILFDTDESTVELGSLFVSPRLRGLGFGQLLVDALITKFDQDNNWTENSQLRMIAKVQYGNYAPLPILNKSGFSVEEISDNEIKWRYNTTAAHQTALRFHDNVGATGVILDVDLLGALRSNAEA